MEFFAGITANLMQGCLYQRYKSLLDHYENEIRRRARSGGRWQKEKQIDNEISSGVTRF
jgi:hypothetical protein